MKVILLTDELYSRNQQNENQNKVQIIHQIQNLNQNRKRKKKLLQNRAYYPSMTKKKNICEMSAIVFGVL